MRAAPFPAFARPAFGRAGGLSLARTGSAVNPVVRMALAIFVLSIPFEMPHRTFSPVEIPTATGALFLLATVIQPSACFRRIPGALLWFLLYMGFLAAAALSNAGDYALETVKYFLEITQLLLIFWVMFNLLSDEYVVRDLLLAIAASTMVRAGIQILGIGATVRAVWTGGDRITALGQNANLSAIILSVGMATVVGLFLYRLKGIPRLALLWWPIAALMGVAIIQTGSRGGLVCAAAGLGAYALYGRTRWAQVRNAVLGLIAMGVLGWGALNSPMMRNRIEDAANQGNLAGRERIYPAFFGMFEERPVLGWGPVNNQYEGAVRIGERKKAKRDAHNLVLELVTTTGIVGAIPFLIGMVLCMRGAWVGRRGRFGAIPLAMLLAVFFGTMSGTWIAGKIVWVVWAFALAAGTYWKDPSPTSSELERCAV